MELDNDKGFRGNASQFFVAGELCRRGYTAVVTLGNTPNVDILCSNKEGSRFVHIQVKTFVPGNRTCSVGMKAMRDFGPSFSGFLRGFPFQIQTNRLNTTSFLLMTWLTTYPKHITCGFKLPERKGRRTRKIKCELSIFHRASPYADGTSLGILIIGS